MPSFYVELTATATVSCRIEVIADNKEAAEVAAIAAARSGEAEWRYDGADDDTIEVESVE